MLHFNYKQYKHAQAAIFEFVAVVVLSVQNRKIRISSWGLTFIFLYGSRGQLVQHQTADSHIFSLVLITSAKTVEMQSWKTNNIMACLENPSLTSKDRTNMTYDKHMTLIWCKLNVKLICQFQCGINFPSLPNYQFDKWFALSHQSSD